MPNQYFATNRKVGDGSTTVWEFSFAGARPDANNGTEPYLESEDVGVALVSYDPEGREVRTPVTFSLISPTQVEVTPAIADGQDFVIFRDTESRLPVSDFTDFASISEQDLDNAIRQTLFAVQELADESFDSRELAVDASGTAIGAEATANQAAADAATAVSTANSALSASSAAIGTANTALSTANAAAADSSAAVVTANDALGVTTSFQGDIDQLQTAVDGLLDSGASTSDLMYKSDNLSGLADNVAARTNLGLGPLATQDLGDLNLGSVAFRNVGTSDDQIRTNQQNDGRYYTQAQVDSLLASRLPTGLITMWSGAVSAIPSGWALCDGTNGTPNLRDRFVVGAGGSYAVGDTGGANTVALALAEMPAHDHGGATGADTHSHTGSTDSAGSHSHSGSTNTTGSHSHSQRSGEGSSAGSYAYGSSGNPNSGVYGPLQSDFSGDHAHSLSINSSGAHTHSVSISSNTHSHTISSAGSGSAHENRPPYYALAYIMKL